MLTNTSEIGTAILPLRRLTIPARTEISPSAQRPALSATPNSPARPGTPTAPPRRPPRFPALACVLALAALATPALAQTEVPSDWSLTPTGLTTGNQFRLLFLSSTKRGGSATDIATYNTFIQNRAAAGHTVQVREDGVRRRLSVLLNRSPQRPVTIPLVVTHVGGESQWTANRQIEARLAEKAKRTPAQRKVSSQLLDARRAADARRQAKDMDTADAMVTVDIRADVTPEVLTRIRALRGTVINSVARYRAIRALLPLEAVEKLATLDAIQSIRAADEAATRDQPTGMPSGARTDAPDAAGTRTVNTSDGNVPH